MWIEKTTDDTDSTRENRMEGGTTMHTLRNETRLPARRAERSVRLPGHRRSIRLALVAAVVFLLAAFGFTEIDRVFASPEHRAVDERAPRTVERAPARPQREAEGERALRAVDRASTRPARAAGERALKAIEAVRVRRLLRELRATEEQKRIIRETYRSGLERKEVLLRERADLLRKMRGLVLARDVVSLRERDLAMRELTKRFLETERQIAEARWSVDEQILEHLGPIQRVRYLLFNETFEKKLRERIETLKQIKRPPAPPAPPVPPTPPAEIPE